MHTTHAPLTAPQRVEIAGLMRDIVSALDTARDAMSALDAGDTVRARAAAGALRELGVAVATNADRTPAPVNPFANLRAPAPETVNPFINVFTGTAFGAFA